MPMTAAALISKPKWSGEGSREPGGPGDPAEIDHAQGNGDQVADHQPDQDRRRREHAAAEELQAQGHEDDDQGQPPVDQGAELRLADQRHAAGGVLDADRDQGQADGQDHDAGHQRRQQVADPADHGAEEEVEDPADDDAAEKRPPMPAVLTTGTMTGMKAKAGALDHRQPGADRAQADGLDQGCRSRRRP